MHNNNPRKLYDLSADQVVIGLFLQNKNFGNSVVNYMLGDNNIEELGEPFCVALENIDLDYKEINLPRFNTSALTSVFLQEGSFFYILRQVAQILNRDGARRISRNDVNRYLETYEIEMEKEGYFRYINLSNPIYGNILSGLDENSSAEKRLIFNILAGNNPNEMQTQLPNRELRAIFEIDKITNHEDQERLRASWILDALISTTTLESQGQLSTQVSNLLTFIKNQNLVNNIEANNLLVKQLRYTIFRSAINRGLSDFVDTFVRNDQSSLSAENNYFASEQAARERREDVQRIILKADDYQMFRKCSHGYYDDLLRYLWERAVPFEGMQREMLKAGNYEAFRVTAHNDGYTYKLEEMWERAVHFEGMQREMLKVNNFEVFRVAVHGGNTDLLNFLWERAVHFEGMQREMLKVNDYEAFRVVTNDHYAVETLNFLWTKAESLEEDAQHAMLKSNSYYAFMMAARCGRDDVVDCLWEKAQSLGEDVQREMLRAGNYGAFKSAARGVSTSSTMVEHLNERMGSAFASHFPEERIKHIEVLDSLWKKAGSLGTGEQHRMLKADHYQAFRVAALNSHDSILGNLWEKAGSLGKDEQCRMLKANHYQAFRKAALNDHHSTLDNLWKKAESLDAQCEMLKANSYEAFRVAAANGHDSTLDNLWKKAKLLDIQLEMLKANSYEAFRMAESNGHDSTLGNLWKKAGSLEGIGKDVQCEMLEASNRRALACMLKSYTNIVSLQGSKGIRDQSEPRLGPQLERPRATQHRIKGQEK